MTLLSNASPPLIQEPLSQPMSILDLFLPGFSNITNAASQVLNGNMSGYTQLMCLFALAALLKPYVFRFIDWFIDHFTSTLRIKRRDETYDMIQAWVSAHGLDDAARSIRAKVNTKRRTHDARTKKPLQYGPWEGAFYFWYGRYLLSYKTTQVDVGFHKEEQISITCVGRSSQILKCLMEDCRREYLDGLKSKTTIYSHRENHWKKEKAVDARPLTTVILDEEQKGQLINDINKFLDPDTKIRYADHSIPYKRGYLLHGPPGTGKTSFSLSIAGALDMDIYVVSIPIMNDEKLNDLFGALPDKCVVLQRSRNEVTKKGVTLSGLLNVLDGVSSQDDRILIMTTNHPEKLDDALTRPGRVDLKIAFQLVNESIANEIYHFMFKQPELDHGNVSQQGDHDGKIKRQAENEEIREMAKLFAAKIPESVFSTAEVIAYLQQHWNSPADAVKHCDQWVDDLHKEKKVKKRAMGKGARQG
uniref:BCS1 N-terminal domain-containing protein n=1 Tax=Bionectria ochroleuca TaxID=29856 RepID=A0A8H7K2N6_BIOOC